MHADQEADTAGSPASEKRFERDQGGLPGALSSYLQSAAIAPPNSGSSGIQAIAELDVHYSGCALWLSLLLMNEELSAPGLEFMVPDLSRPCVMFFPWTAVSARKASSHLR
jgi:hypothetical protein